MPNEYRLAAVSADKANRFPWGWAVGTALVLEVALVASTFGWVAIYSYVIHPGETLPFYERYAQAIGPILSVVVGIPYWFFACWWVGRNVGTRAVAVSVAAWCVLVAIDVPLNFLADLRAVDWIMVAISMLTKLLAAYLGAKAALRDVPQARVTN